MLLRAETEIDPDEDAAMLTQRLARLGAEILPATLHQFAAGTLKPTEQDTTQVSHAPNAKKTTPGLTGHSPLKAFIIWYGAKRLGLAP